MGICGRLMSLYRREETPVEKRGKVCLANGELYTLKYRPHLRVRDICIEIAKLLNVAPVALDFFTLMTTECEHCLRPNYKLAQQCDKQKDHYLNPKRVLHAEEISSKVFFFRLSFKAVPGPELKLVDNKAYEYFVMQCRWDYINGRINYLSRKNHLTLLILEAIIRANEENVSSKEILENPKRYGLAHLFVVGEEYSVREIKNHLKKQLSQFKTAQNNVDKAKNSFLFVLESVTDFGVTKIIVKKFYYQSANEDVTIPVEWEILISANGLKKRRTYKDEGDVNSDDTTTGSKNMDEMISDYKDIEYLEIKQSESDEIINISRQKGFLEVISVGKSMIKKESLITLIEGFYHLLVNQYKTLTRYEASVESSSPRTHQNQKLELHGPIERKKVELLLKAVETENGDRSGVHMIRRSRNAFDTYILSLIHGADTKHYEIVFADDKYNLKSGPTFDSLRQLLEFYKTEQSRFPTKLTKYCPIPREGLCALYDDQIVVEIPSVPSTSRPANPEYLFEYIGNLQLQQLHHTFTCGDYGGRVFKARWLKGDNGGCQEVFCRRLEPSRAANFREKVVKCGESMAGLVHRNLVQFHGVCFFDEHTIYLTFEWISSGTLDDYLTKETEVTVETIITFAAQIAEACMFLHEKNYVHGWLAAHNVLVVSEEQVKLSDVSVPCLREEDMLNESETINRSPWKARECFQGRRYSKESDVWAFGVVLWEMFTKTKPFQNMPDDRILQVFQQGHHLARPKWCPEDVGKIMKSCWITEPPGRPTFNSIVVKLRQIMMKLTPEERNRKIPETIDEKFAIEPLMTKNKTSPSQPDENLPRTSSCSSGSSDNSDGTLKDIGSNEGSYLCSMSDDSSQLDLIPEKESPEMVWSPEEIEMKKFEGKYPRHALTMDPSSEATYDRINEMDTSFEATDHLLASEHESFVVEERHIKAVAMNEIQTAEDDPIKQQAHPTEDKTTTSEDGRQLGSAEGHPTEYDRLSKASTEDDPSDGEEKPLISKTNPDSIFASLETMDHMGFLASQLGSDGTVMDNVSTSVDNDGTLMNNDSAVDADSGISDQESTGVPEGSCFLSGNLDPFAADFEDRASLIFSKLNSGTQKNSGNSIAKQVAPDEGKYISNTRFALDFKHSEFRPGNLNSMVVNPVMVKQSPNSPYVMESAKPGQNAGSPPSLNPRRPRYNGYIPTPSGVKSRQAPGNPTRADSPTGSPQASSGGLVEFSKLDPFAISSAGISGGESDGGASGGGASGGCASGGVPPSFLNDAGLSSKHTISMHRQPIITPSHGRVSDKDERNDSIADGSLFSSFLDRDPMSELATNDRKQPSGLVAQTSKNTDKPTKQGISSNVNKTNSTYVSPNSLGLTTYRESSDVRKVPQQALNKHTNRSGYVSMRGNSPIKSPSTNQKPNPKSHDVVTADMSFGNLSERDPFSEAVSKENKIDELNSGNSQTTGMAQDFKPRVLGPPGNSPKSVGPMGITSAAFDGLFSKSRGARSPGFVPPGTKLPGFASRDMKPPGLVPRATSPSASNPQPSLQIAFRPQSSGKPSLSNLALKLSESRQSTLRSSLPKKPSSEGSTTASSSGGPQPSKSKKSVSSSSKMSGYVAVSKSKNPENSKAFKVHAIDEANAIQSNHPDSGSLSNRDIFTDILQSAPAAVCDRSSQPFNMPSSANVEPFSSSNPSSFGGVKLYTQAESDKDTYQKISTRNVQGKNIEAKANYVQTSGRISKHGQSRAGSTSGNTNSTENGTNTVHSSYFKVKQSPPSRIKSNSTSLQPNTVQSSSETASNNNAEKLGGEKSTEQEARESELETVSQFSTTLEDLFGSMTFSNKDEIRETKPSQEIELDERTSQGTPPGSTDPKNTETATSTVLGNFGDSQIHAGMEVDEESEGLTFENRDPFAELSSSRTDLNRNSSQELNVIKNSPENEKCEPDEDCENIVPEEAPSRTESKAVVVTSYSNSPAPEPFKQQGDSNETPPLGSGTPPGNSGRPSAGGSPPDDNSARSPPPLGEKPKASRKVSDIGMEYAQVSIQRTSYEEPVIGAVGGSETVPELSEQDIPAEPVSEGDDDKTVVDPFNIPAAEESIENLDPYRLRHPGKREKVAETFEESMKSHQIPFESLAFNENERELGRGAFGVVRKAKLTRPGRDHRKTRPPMDVAVKCLRDNASEIYKDSFKQEAINLMKLENQFIVRFLGVSYNEQGNMILVTELVPQGSLDKYLKDSKNLKILGNEVLLQFAIQITTGMQYLETKKLVHRDLAARNILVATEAHVKISDFGLSRIYDDEYYRSHREQKLPVRWLAPECLEQKKFTSNSDVWSLGVTLWEMFSYGKRPYEGWNFDTASGLMKLLKSGEQLSRPPACPEEIYAYVRECWDLAPQRRISFFLLKTLLEDILKDKYSKKPYFMP